ncbi:MAG: hypothetical protein VW546_08885, partial [Gammaproteobacteria bacterium]
EGLWTLDTARKLALRSWVINLPEGRPGPGFAKRLQASLKEFTAGDTAVFLRFPNENGDRVSIALGEQWQVTPSDALFEVLSHFCDQEGLEFHYDPRRLLSESAGGFEFKAA